jgi:hypothetical protein
MLLVREVMHCRPGKVRPLVEKFLAMSRLMEEKGLGTMRITTDLCAERYWTMVAEMEVPDMETYMAIEQNEENAEAFEEIMRGYHELVESGRREIYTIEG